MQYDQNEKAMNRAVKFGWIGTFFLTALLSVPVQAGVINTYTGSDPGAVPGGSHFFSDIAANSFRTAVGPSLNGSINFENMSVGAGVPLSFAGGTITADNPSSPLIAQVQTGGSAAMGFNTTAGGANYFRVDQDNASQRTLVTFTFDSPIWAFGAYITGLGTSTGSLNVWVNDGQIETLPVSGSATGGSIFFGFLLNSKTSAVNFQLNPVGGVANDGFGIDDVAFATAARSDAAIPEPGTFALLGLSAISLGLLRRDRR